MASVLRGARLRLHGHADAREIAGDLCRPVGRRDALCHRPPFRCDRRRAGRRGDLSLQPGDDLHLRFLGPSRLDLRRSRAARDLPAASQRRFFGSGKFRERATERREGLDRRSLARLRLLAADQTAGGRAAAADARLRAGRARAPPGANHRDAGRHRRRLTARAARQRAVPSKQPGRGIRLAHRTVRLRLERLSLQ